MGDLFVEALEFPVVVPEVVDLFLAVLVVGLELLALLPAEGHLLPQLLDLPE